MMLVVWGRALSCSKVTGWCLFGHLSLIAALRRWSCCNKPQQWWCYIPWMQFVVDGAPSSSRQMGNIYHKYKIFVIALKPWEDQVNPIFKIMPSNLAHDFVVLKQILNVVNLFSFNDTWLIKLDLKRSPEVSIIYLK